MREIILTDLHGCLDETQALLKQIDFCSTDIIVGLSDSVDKGPYSAELIKYFYSLPNEKYPILGNHEFALLRFVRKYLAGGGQKNAAYEERKSIFEKLTSEEFEWIKTFKAWHPLKNTKSIVLHAGVKPSRVELPEQHFSASNSRGANSELFYTRYLDDTSSVFWADEYDGRFGHIYYGHQPWKLDSVRISPYATGLDLNGVAGGSLAAAIINPNGTVEFCTQKVKKYHISKYD